VRDLMGEKFAFAEQMGQKPSSKEVLKSTPTPVAQPIASDEAFKKSIYQWGYCKGNWYVSDQTAKSVANALFAKKGFGIAISAASEINGEAKSSIIAHKAEFQKFYDALKSVSGSKDDLQKSDVRELLSLFLTNRNFATLFVEQNSRFLELAKSGNGIGGGVFGVLELIATDRHIKDIITSTANTGTTSFNLGLRNCTSSILLANPELLDMLIELKRVAGGFVFNQHILQTKNIGSKQEFVQAVQAQIDSFGKNKVALGQTRQIQ